MNISREQLEALIADEEKAYAEYTKLGLNSIASDEKRHASILRKLYLSRFGH